MIKDYYRLVIVIPIGPLCIKEYIEDSIESIRYYGQCSCKIILADDSQTGIATQISATDPSIDVILTPRPMGKLCGLYITLSRAFDYALHNYQFEALLRMDTDALIIGFGFETKALELFKHHPQMGLAGQYPLDFNGNLWDRSWPDSQLRKICHTRYFFRMPLSHAILILHYLKARMNGYVRGESVFGGVCFYNYSCLEKLLEKKLLPQFKLKKINLEEDHLFSLLAKAVGFELGSLSGKDLPMACAWKGLPAHPDLLIGQEKKIIHSVRFYKNMTESEIRAWFKKRRVLRKQITLPH